MTYLVISDPKDPIMPHRPSRVQYRVVDDTNKIWKLPAACRKWRLPYPSVAKALRETEGWPFNTPIVGPFEELLKGVRARTHASAHRRKRQVKATGFIECPHCGEEFQLIPPAVTTTNTIDAAEADGARDNTIPTP